MWMHASILPFESCCLHTGFVHVIVTLYVVVGICKVDLSPATSPMTGEELMHLTVCPGCAHMRCIMSLSGI